MSERDALAAKHFPDEWADAKDLLGGSKRLQKLRQRGEYMERTAALRASGASCANCRSFNTRPVFGLNMKATCDAQSDFYGYVEARPDGLCVRWKLREDDSP